MRLYSLRDDLYSINDNGNVAGFFVPIKSEFIQLDVTQQRDLKAVLGSNGGQSNPAYDRLQKLNIFKNGKTNSWNIDFNQKPEDLEIYVELTQGCNFRCTGCASGVDQRQGKISSIDEEKLKVFLKRTFESMAEKGMTQVRLKWAGGEPLLAHVASKIEHIQPWIQTLVKQYQVDLTQIILTNGSLLSRNIDLIKRAGINHVSVSLWGVGEYNAIMRNAPKNTFPDITEGLRMLHDLGISFNVNHVLTPTNADHLREFLTVMWDVNSDEFIGQDWNWDDKPMPIPVGISFFRPQTKLQSEFLKNKGYAKMVEGMLDGLKRVREMIVSGVKIQPLTQIDYFNFNYITSATCGTGENYVVFGPKGVTCCHERLLGMTQNDEAMSQTNVIDLANQQFDGDKKQLLSCFKEFPSSLAFNEKLTLMLHGGSGCPYSAKAENDGSLTQVGSAVEKLYAPILNDLLLTELYRRSAA